MICQRKGLYFLNDTEVKESEFNGFHKSLKMIEDTYYSQKTIYGGRVNYEAEDEQGVRYRVRLADEKNISKHIINKAYSAP